ncbi:hypothetical protein OAR43_10095 [Gammaproteobacteria bacterium]|jgi:hypothetical protein|nr:hypothetical protein [Gammaproteobacteria bacterium]
MKILKLGFALPLILVGLIGCSGSSNSGTYVDVSGVWSGSWVSSRGQSGGLSASFTQDAGTFSGSATIGNSVCFGKEFATGKLNGSGVEIGVSSGAILFNGTVSGSTISGTYGVSGTGCSGDVGTFVLRR